MATKRIDFLPEIGQQLMKAIAAETVSFMKEHTGCRYFHLHELMVLADIPFEFEKRWNIELAIREIMSKACEYGFVNKHSNSHWSYIGPEATKAEIDKKKREAKRIKDINAWAKSKGLKLSKRVGHWGKESINVQLPKKLWSKD